VFAKGLTTRIMLGRHDRLTGHIFAVYSLKATVDQGADVNWALVQRHADGPGPTRTGIAYILDKYVTAEREADPAV
jgi:hypothetical protein